MAISSNEVKLTCSTKGLRTPKSCTKGEGTKDTKERAADTSLRRMCDTRPRSEWFVDTSESPPHPWEPGLRGLRGAMFMHPGPLWCWLAVFSEECQQRNRGRRVCMDQRNRVVFLLRPVVLGQEKVLGATLVLRTGSQRVIWVCISGAWMLLVIVVGLVVGLGHIGLLD